MVSVFRDDWNVDPESISVDFSGSKVLINIFMLCTLVKVDSCYIIVTSAATTRAFLFRHQIKGGQGELQNRQILATSQMGAQPGFQKLNPLHVQKWMCQSQINMIYFAKVPLCELFWILWSRSKKYIRLVCMCTLLSISRFLSHSHQPGLACYLSKHCLVCIANLN